MVGLMGEPGMGKSRLCYEGITRHLSSPWACLETRAVAYGQAIPYLPMIDLLKAYFGSTTAIVPRPSATK